MKPLESFRAVFCIMARRPGTGAAKTRLSERLSESARARLYEAFLKDKLAHVALLRGVHVVLAVAPPDGVESMAPWTPVGASVIAQRGADLGARLEAVAADIFDAGARAVVIIDSDTPTLPVAFLEEAVIALESGLVDVVFGPAQDGGYYLVGLRGPQPSLFRAVPWSTPAVLRASLLASDAGGLRIHLLQSWYDVDEPSDLERLGRELRTMSPFAPGFPRETAYQLSNEGFATETPRNEHWTTRSARTVYSNRWLEATESVVTLPSGHVTLYGIVRTAHCVGILPLVGSTHVILVRQFRYVARRFTWEMPTGGVHPGESLEDAARRELREEAEVEALVMRPLLSFDTSKSVVEETAHLFVASVDGAATGLVSHAERDDTEEIERQIFSLEQAYAMCASGDIVDGMTIVALLATRSTAL